jgi:hypothetical protein
LKRRRSIKLVQDASAAEPDIMGTGWDQQARNVRAGAIPAACRVENA